MRWRPKAVDGALGGFSQMRLELRERFFDRVEVGAVGRQEQQVGAGGLDGLANGLPFVAGQIIHDDDVTGRELGHEYLGHIGGKGIAVDGAIDHHGCHHAGIAQPGDERRRFPVAMGNAGAKPLTTSAPAMPACHVGAGPRLVDEHQSIRIKIELTLEPGPAPAKDVGPLLLGGVRGLFYA